MLHTGRITQIELSSKGSPVYGVSDHIDRYHFPCFPLSPMGGANGIFSNQGFDIGSNVVFITHPENKATFIILGGIVSRGDNQTLRVHGVETALISEKLFKRHRTTPVLPSIPEVPDDSDTIEIHVNDQHIENKQSFINLSEKNGLTLQGAKTITRIQVRDKLHISRQNNSDESIVNSSIIQDLQEIIGKLTSSFQVLIPTLPIATQTAITPLISEANQAMADLQKHKNNYVKIPSNGSDS